MFKISKLNIHRVKLQFLGREKKLDAVNGRLDTLKEKKSELEDIALEILKMNLENEKKKPLMGNSITLSTLVT